jgi:hypothetical protein
MSRSGYSEDPDNWRLIRWRGAVASAIRGRRGQAFLRELAAALDALPDKRLIEGAAHRDGAYCALGALARAREMDVERVNRLMDDQSFCTLAEALDIPVALACEIMHTNDESPHWRPEEPELRWQRMREWVGRLIA